MICSPATQRRFFSECKEFFRLPKLTEIVENIFEDIYIGTIVYKQWLTIDK